MREIEMDTVAKGNKLLAEMRVLNGRKGFDFYDCIIDSGADTFHVNVTKEQLEEFNFVPFQELRLKTHTTFPMINGEKGKFVNVRVGTAIGDVLALEGILRCIKIGNFMIKRPKCTVFLLPSTKENQRKDPVFLFPLLYVMKHNIVINQTEQKIQSRLEGNSICFTYSSRGEGRVYSNVDDIDKVSYEMMLQMEEEEFLFEEDSFVEELFHGIEETI